MPATNCATLAPTPSPAHDFLAGGGEMGELIRRRDWSATPIGPVESWSPALRMMVRFLLANRFPLLLWWGPDYVSIYNDPYRPVLGAKHPAALGQPVRECWSEIWHVLKPLIDTPFQGGPATWNEDIFLEINRHGFVEETHFTIAYSPVPDETVPSGIGGVLATVHEISARVVAERRVVVLRDLGTGAGDAKTAEEACAVVANTLCAHSKDIPFALLYLTDADGKRVRLAGACGVGIGEAVSPPTISLEPADGGWPVSEAMRSDEMIVVDGLAARFTQVPPGPWSEPPRTALVMSIPSNKVREPAGLMVVGVSSRLQLDQYYWDFLALVRTQVATAISNARAYEEEKRRAEALAEIDRAKTAFFSNVSHEFRTPLTLMLSPVDDSLTDTTEPLMPVHRERLELIRRNGLRLQKLVNTLLDFSRIEAGRAQATYVPTDLAALTADLASSFRSAVEKAGLRLVVDTPSLAEPVYVDEEMWEKIVLNLLSNAFKFTFDGEIAVRLRVAPAGDRITLVVRDTGTGIPAAALPHIFERFHRVSGGKSRTHEGTGIGLALVQELVKLHGGEVNVESQEGRGTTFTVTIPLGKTHLPADRIGAAPRSQTSARVEQYVAEALRWLPGAPDVPAASPSTAAPATRPRILWVDDNADMRGYVRRLLSSRYVVDTVPDGAAALAAATACPPDLVLSDVMMPGLDGFGLLRALRNNPQTSAVPVILLSARAGEESRIEGVQAGADDYLIKPFSQRELLACVEGQLRLAQQRREASAALEQRSAQFEALLNQAPLGVYLVDADFKIRQVNPVALPVFGNVPGGVVGRDFNEIIHILWERPYADEVAAIFRHTLETGEPYITPERAEYRADRGIMEYYEWRLHRIPLPDGRHGVVCYFRDISAQVHARLALEENRHALQEADRRKDEFLATLSHELRNPLAPLRNALHVMRIAGQGPSELAPVRQMMERQVNHLVRLVDDLLEMSRISRGVLELRTERVDLNQIAADALEVNEPHIRSRDHEVHVALAPTPTWVRGDPLRLTQVMGNLLNNAIKYTPQGGQIWVTLERSGSDALFAVRDNGVGISAQALPRVFDLFHRGDRLGAETGLGIGLTLVQTLVQMHGGSVTAYSAGPGNGSTFTVRLPLAAASEPAVVTDRRVSRRLAPQRVLIVDDNRDGADSLHTLLCLLGAEVQVARDGPQALAAVTTYRPAVVLLDIGMPGMNGYEVAQRIRADATITQPTIVALTGWGQPEDRRRAREAGFDHHLIKPADLVALQRILDQSST
ncbi:MAG: response regulator receiver protein [Gemmatimonadetes bacterium]|nr:MAG: response regulator receiver protein [Gemmatimonadota bacterium]